VLLLCYYEKAVSGILDGLGMIEDTVRQKLLRESGRRYVSIDMMNKHSLDPLLEAYRRKELPSAPTNLEQNVWREIRLQAESAPNAVWQGFLDWVLNRRMVTASLVTAMVIGAVFNLQPQQVTARQAMGLQVFGHSLLVELAQNP